MNPLTKPTNDRNKPGEPGYAAPALKGLRGIDASLPWLKYVILAMILFSIGTCVFTSRAEAADTEFFCAVDHGDEACPWEGFRYGRGGDCCLDAGDCVKRERALKGELKACQSQDPVVVTREKIVREKAPPCEAKTVEVEKVVEVPVYPAQPRNAIGGGLAAFFVPDYDGDYEVELGPALSYQRFFAPRWRIVPDELHVGVSGAEVDTNKSRLGFCKTKVCLFTDSRERWLYQATAQAKWRF